MKRPPMMDPFDFIEMRLMSLEKDIIAMKDGPDQDRFQSIHDILGELSNQVKVLRYKANGAL